MNYSIALDKVSKRYRIRGSLPTLRDILGNRRESGANRYHWALRDFSFTLHAGEALAIIGPNGAGKTTTLKLLSNVTRPTSGCINVNGRLSALIELGAGFHPDLTGRENIFLNATILGMSRPEVRARFDQIVEFAGVKQYLDTSIKRYSSGMIARLGFAVAAHVDPEILLVDEVLAVGDYSFRMKCYERMDELRQKGTSLIFVSHNMEDVRRVCNRGIVLFDGQKAFEGSAAEAVAEYANVLRRNASKSSRLIAPGDNGLAQRRMTHGARIEKVQMFSEDGRATNTVHSGEVVTIAVTVHFEEDAPSPVFAPTIHGEKGELVYDTSTRVLGIETPTFRAGDRARVLYKLQVNLLDGIYKLTTDLAYTDLSCYYDYVVDALNFVVVGGDKAKGIANLCADVSFETLSTQNGSATTATDRAKSTPQLQET